MAAICSDLVDVNAVAERGRMMTQGGGIVLAGRGVHSQLKLLAGRALA